MRRGKNNGLPDYRGRMVALTEALNRLIIALRPHVEGEPDWLQMLVGLACDVRDLVDADAHLDANDLRDVCKETKSLFDSLKTEAAFARRYRQLIAQRPDLRTAHADCIRAYREICAQCIGFEK